MAKVEPLGIGFQQKYNEPTGQIQELNPAHVVDLVTPPGPVARTAVKALTSTKSGKLTPAKVGKKARKGKK